MGQRARNSGLLSMMDSPELRGLAAYLQGRRALRDNGGHGGGAGDLPHPDDDDAADDTDEDQDDDESSEEDDADSDKDKKSDKEDDDTDPDDKPKYTAREYEKLKRRLAASDKRQGTLQRQLEDLKKGKEGELDKAVKAEIEELKPKVSKLDTDNRALRLQVAFLTTPVKGVVWQDADAAMKLIDLSDVDIDPDTGAIDKRDLAAAMRQLAKSKPYLVKKSSSSNEDDDTDKGRSANEMNGRRKGKKPVDTDRDALARRFPVLGRP